MAKQETLRLGEGEEVLVVVGPFFLKRFERVHIFWQGLCSKPPALRLLPPALPSLRLFFGKNGLGALARPFRAPAPAELRPGLEHVPVSPWGLNNGVSGTAGSPCLQVRRREAAISPLLRPESGTKTRPGPNRSRTPGRYAHSSRSEADSRFFTPKKRR